MRKRRTSSPEARPTPPLRLLFLGGSAIQALALFGCTGDPTTNPTPDPTQDGGAPDMLAANGTQCSDPQSKIGCNRNARVGETCWTGGAINDGLKGACVGPYVLEKPNAFASPVNNALCTCKTP